MVAKTFTTAFSTALDLVSAPAPADAGATAASDFAGSKATAVENVKASAALRATA
jgi:hypothetical protein